MMLKENPTIEIFAMDELCKAIGSVGDAVQIAGYAISDSAGFSFRDEVAVRVIQSLAAQPDQTGMSPSFIAEHAYSVADAAIKARDAKRGK